MPTLCSPFASEPNVGGAENPCIGGRAGAGGRLGEAMSRLSGGYPSAPRWSASPTPRAPRFRRSELAAVGRRELLRWVNRTVGVDYVQVESCADGVALAQLIDAAYPDARVPLYRLDFATRHEHDRARNLEVVRATLDRLDLDVPLDVKEVSRGVYRACDEALRWLYLVVQRERPPSATRGYDGRARRLEALQKRGYLARAPSKSPGWRSAASWDERGSGGDPSCASPSAAATPSAYAYDPATPYATPSSSDAGSDARKRGSIEIRARVDRKSSSFAAASRAPTREENDERTPEEATVSVGNRTPASPIRTPAARQTRVFFAGAVPAAVRPVGVAPALVVAATFPARALSIVVGVRADAGVRRRRRFGRSRLWRRALPPHAGPGRRLLWRTRFLLLAMVCRLRVPFLQLGCYPPRCGRPRRRRLARRRLQVGQRRRLGRCVRRRVRRGAGVRGVDALEDAAALLAQVDELHAHRSEPIQGPRLRPPRRRGVTRVCVRCARL